MIKKSKLKRSNPETITKNFRKVLNEFINKNVGVYGPNIHFHGKLKESDDSGFEIQITNGNDHGDLFFSSKHVKKIILDQPNQQKIQIFIDLCN